VRNAKRHEGVKGGGIPRVHTCVLYLKHRRT